MKKVKKRKLLWRSLLVVPILFLLAPLTVGFYLTHPFPARTTKNPNDYGIEFEEFEFLSRKDRVKLSGWWIAARSSKKSNKVVITAHGYTNERSMEGIEGLLLAKVLSDNGYNVLMFDFRNAGKSKGRTTGIGYFEKHDLYSAIDYSIQEKQQEKIALLGWSMGASTAIVAGCEHPSVSVVIADSPFGNLYSYLRENLSFWTKLPKLPFTPMIIHSMRRLLKIDLNEVSPITKVKNGEGKSFFLIHSKKDEAIPYSESENIFQSISSGHHKELWLTEDAEHINSYLLYKEEYENRVLKFLHEHLA
ncbi:alpha/beta hydrolase [Neobacillus ginsengisoli]|uniref:Fermentation-respiration switch protein FrsA (DUF1100 family) n=1 Tax=Neobacillus ginsengisoli TaxID=904295 RepID=A0ABT9XYD8_9BACI|nr:alpha/beta hydrolase [Neobacillus ginsengisoli]MDQ0200280.1 fermentation-respiration switch protein FrsA (DUF1100 family) [Neobacillus ginsengisoli]